MSRTHLIGHIMASMSKLVFKCISTYNPLYLIDHVQTHWTRGKVDIWMVDFIHKANAEHTLVLVIDKKYIIPWRFEWVFIWQFDFDSPHATLVWCLFWAIKLDDELLQRVSREIYLILFWFLYCWYFLNLLHAFHITSLHPYPSGACRGLANSFCFFYQQTSMDRCQFKV